MGGIAGSIQTMGRVWLIQDTTHSPLLVATVAAVSGLPLLLLAFVGGYIADRFSRKWISVAGEAMSVLFAAALASLAIAELAEAWHVIALSALQGVMAALVASARQTLVADLVPSAQQRGAIGLFFLVANLAGIAGPAVAGALIPSFGTDVALAVGAGVGLVSVPLYMMLRRDTGGAKPQPGHRMMRDVADGIRYVARSASLRWLMLSATIMLVTVSSRGAVFPPLVQDVLGRGAGSLGVLEMVGGIGAVLGPLAAVMLSRRYSDLKVENVSGFIFAVSVVLMAVSPWFELTVLLGGIAAFIGTVFFTTNLAAIQLSAPTELRGRVVSVRFVISGIHPVGVIALGAVAEVMEPRTALFIFALGGILLLALLNLVLPSREQPGSGAGGAR